VPFAFCGLASVWSEAGNFLPLEPLIIPILWAFAAVAFLVVSGLHLRFGYLSKDAFMSQVRHPIQSPLLALIPMIVALVGDSLRGIDGLLSQVIVIFGFLLWVLACLMLLVVWFQGHYESESLHGGYFLPFAGASSVFAVVASHQNWAVFAQVFVWVGLCGWFTFAGLLTWRLIRHSPIPRELISTQSILTAPPALLAVAELNLEGTTQDASFLFLLSLTALSLVFQGYRLPSYLRLKFGPGHWTFTFPSASLAVLGMSILAETKPPGWQLLAVAALVLVTLLVVSNSVLTVIRK
jgi:tellurite resistance protein